jgi:hypothetical protein
MERNAQAVINPAMKARLTIIIQVVVKSKICERSKKDVKEIIC